MIVWWKKEFPLDNDEDIHMSSKSYEENGDVHDYLLIVMHKFHVLFSPKKWMQSLKCFF